MTPVGVIMLMLGGAGGYCPHVRRFILVSRLQA